jgi:Lysylphosphatidylglycerol synthase TM region
MKRGHLIVAFIGAAIFAWVVTHIGLRAILQQLSGVRAALPIVLLMSLCRLLLQTNAWSRALRDQGVSVHPATLMGVRLASQSMGYLTVLGPVISEPLKIRLLRAPAEPAMIATFLDDGVYWFTTILIGIAGWLCLPLIAVHGAKGGPAALAITLLGAILVFMLREKPALFALVRRLDHHAPRWLVRAAILEQSLRNYRLKRPTVVNRMFWTDVTCQLLVAAEVVVVLRSLHLPVHFLAVLAIDGITRGLKMATGWIPARLGSDEGGAISAFAVTGFASALGLALALTRRVRDLLWAVIGLCWLVWRFRRTSTSASQDTLERTPASLLQEGA